MFLKCVNISKGLVGESRIYNCWLTKCKDQNHRENKSNHKNTETRNNGKSGLQKGGRKYCSGKKTKENSEEYDQKRSWKQEFEMLLFPLDAQIKIKNKVFGKKGNEWSGELRCCHQKNKGFQRTLGLGDEKTSCLYCCQPLFLISFLWRCHSICLEHWW